MCYLGWSFSSKEQAAFSFMAAVTICSDFGTQKNKVCFIDCMKAFDYVNYNKLENS